MPTVTCICKECGQHFFMKDQLYTPARSNKFRLSSYPVEPKTWEDWVNHIANNCENCRLKEIPESCQKDFEKLTRQS